MTAERDQKPKEGEPATGLTPVQLGFALGLAALAWMIADWLWWAASGPVLSGVEGPAASP